MKWSTGWKKMARMNASSAKEIEVYDAQQSLTEPEGLITLGKVS